MASASANLIIGLTDQFSGKAGGVGRAADQLSKTMSKLQALGSKMHGMGALSIAAPAGLSLASAGHDAKEYDKLAHQFKAIAEVSDVDLSKIETQINRVSNATGVSRIELMGAAKTWMELGNSPKSFIENAEVAARTSRITGVTVGEQLKETSALLRAFKGTDYTKDDFKHFEEVYLVASKGMAGGAHAFGEAMKAWGPVAAGMGLTIEQAAAFAQTLGGQFQPGEIGNSLKTGFLRLAAPTPKSSAALRFAGINEATLYNVDKGKLSGSAMAEGLRGAGFNVSKSLERQLGLDIASTDVSKGTNALVDKLRGTLTEAFGRRTKNGKAILGADEGKIVQQALLSLVGNAKVGLNPEEFFKQFGPHSKNLALIQQVFGKEHAAKFMDLLKQGDHWLHNYENIVHKSPGALDRKWSIFGEGFSFQIDRMQAAFQNFLGSVGASGVLKDLTGAFERLAGFFERLQSANPQLMRVLFWVTAMVAVLPVFGIYLATSSTALAALSAAATGASGAMMWFGRSVLFAGAQGGFAALAAGLRTAITLLGVFSVALFSGGISGALSFLGTMLAATGAAIGTALTAGFAAAAAAVGGFVVAALPVIAIVAAIAAAGYWIYQNWAGIGEFFKGIGEGFREAFAPVQPIVDGLSSSLGSLFSWLGKMLGPIDETGTAWRGWGRSVGAAIAYPIVKLMEMYDWLSKIFDKITGVEGSTGAGLKAWRKLLGLDSKDAPVATDKAAAGSDYNTSGSSPGMVSTGAKPIPGAPSLGTAAPADVKQQAEVVVISVQNSMDRVRNIIASVDLRDEGVRLMESLAAGITAGEGALQRATSGAVGRGVKSRIQGSFGDGGYN